MKRITHRSIALAAIFVFALTSLAMGAPKSRRDGAGIKVSGSVLKIDKQSRTLLISSPSTEKLYLVTVPKGAYFKIKFGIRMRLEQPSFEDVSVNDRVEIICKRPDNERLARLVDDRQAIALAAIN